MKKIFSVIVLLFLFNAYFLFFNVPPQYAGIKCRCLHPGATGRGAHKTNDFFTAPNGGNNGDNSGFVCDKDPSQVTLCQDFKEACFNDSNVKDATYDWSKFPDDKIDGVRCAIPGPAETVQCKCLTPGIAEADKNGYVCTLNGIDHNNRPFSYTNTPLPDRNDYCGNSNFACWDDPTYTANQGERDRTFFPWNYQHGIVCSADKPANSPNVTSSNPLPLPPAPPCASDLTKTGGICLEVLTAFGPIGTDPGAFITRLFGILLAASGSIAVLLIMRAGYHIMTSRGNPEGIKEGREQLVAAIVGLTFLIFSFVLLQIIGVDLLKIPGFS